MCRSTSCRSHLANIADGSDIGRPRTGGAISLTEGSLRPLRCRTSGDTSRPFTIPFSPRISSDGTRSGTRNGLSMRPMSSCSSLRGRSRMTDSRPRPGFPVRTRCRTMSGIFRNRISVACPPLLGQAGGTHPQRQAVCQRSGLHLVFYRRAGVGGGARLAA